jgi:hypothetical protein
MKNLKDHALWLIMDPWYPTPIQQDLKDYPNLDRLQAQFVNRIALRLQSVQHVAVSCPMEVDGVPAHVAAVFAHYPNTYNSLENLVSIMSQRNLTQIVYCGFHYGHCILSKPDGAMYTHKLYKTWVNRDLCCVLPYDNIAQHTRNTIKYAKLI